MGAEATACFSANCLARVKSAKTTASWPCRKMSAACSAVSSGPSKACNEAASRVSIPLVAIRTIQHHGRKTARLTEFG